MTLRHSFMALLRTRKLWDMRLARFYNRGMEELTEALYLSLREWLRSEVFSRLPRGSRILDAGCGPGHMTAWLARDVPQAALLALDRSSTMIGTAALNLARLATRCALVCGDIHQLPFADNTVDVILSTCSLKWWADPVACMNEIHRVAKPGATIVLVEMNREATREERDSWRRCLAAALPWPIRMIRAWTFEHIAVERSFSAADVESIVSKSSFREAALATVPGYPFMRATLYKRAV